nr:urea ABC transporter permease subunit UrtB [uncultured Desulfobacter sp.]
MFTSPNKRFSTLLFTLAFAMLTACFSVYSPNAAASAFEEGLEKLTQNNFNHKIQGLEQIFQSKDPQVGKLFSALLDGDLYYTKVGNEVVYASKKDGEYTATGVLSNELTQQIGSRSIQKIGINNKIRKKLKGWLSLLQLYHGTPRERADAVYRILGMLNPEMVETLNGLYNEESDGPLKEALATAIALDTLETGDKTAQLSALSQLEGSLQPAVKNRVIKVLDKEKDGDIQKKARKTLQSIESKIAFYGFLETLFFGLSAGSILVLAAIGLAITFGVIGVINMAHGELIMIGAYTTWVIQQMMPNHLGLAICLAVPGAFLVSALSGIAIERSIIRFLYGRPLETLLATFGVSLVLQQAVRSIFSPLNRAVSTPEWMSGSLVLNPVLSLTMNRIVIFFFCLLVFGALFLIMKKTSLGLQVRAVSQNRNMARAMGVPASRVDALTFGLGSGIAGVAGVALSQLTNVGPNLGQAYIIDSFMVVVFGGVGNLWGTMLAGLTLGTANKFIEPFAGAVLAKIIVLVFIILFIQKRPQGLFPQKGRAAG